MDCTVHNIRREYETPTTLWVRVLALAATFLVVAELIRFGRNAEWGWPLWLGLAAIAAGVGWLVAVFLSIAVRRASFDSELWRKFGLSKELLDACNDLPLSASDVEGEVNLALLHTRTLAALANNADWDASGAPDATGLAETAEQALLACLRAADGVSRERMHALAMELQHAAMVATATLAALRHDEAVEVRRHAADELATTHANLRRWAESGGCGPDAETPSQ